MGKAIYIYNNRGNYTVYSECQSSSSLSISDNYRRNQLTVFKVLTQKNRKNWSQATHLTRGSIFFLRNTFNSYSQKFRMIKYR